MYFSFKPTGAKLGSGVAVGATNKSAFLTFDVQHALGDRVFTPNRDADLTQSPWTFQVYESDVYNPNIVEMGGTGLVRFHKRSGNFHVTLAIGAKVFKQLTDVLLAGRMPFSLTVEVKPEFEGKEVLKYGSLPDGREVIWDLEAGDMALIVAFDFYAPVSAVAVDDDGNAGTSVLPVSNADLERFGAALKGEIQGSIAKPLLWIALGIGVLVVKALFFHG